MVCITQQIARVGVIRIVGIGCFQFFQGLVDFIILKQGFGFCEIDFPKELFRFMFLGFQF